MTRKTTYSRFALLVVVAGATTLAVLNRDRFDPDTLDTWLAAAGVWAPLAHVVLFAVATVVFAPGAIFALVGGAMFGPVLGTLLNLTGATIGAAFAFLIARYLAGDWVARRSGGRLSRLVEGVESEGWRFVAFVRLVPVFPFNLSNYAFGLTRIPFAAYVVTSFITMAPGALAYTWLGHAGRAALDGNGSAIRYGLMALGLLAAIAFLPRLISRLRGGGASWTDALTALARLSEPEPPILLDVRSTAEFDDPQGHIPGALNFPLDEVAARIGEIAALADNGVITVCRTDRRSALAAKLLTQAGIGDVSVLKGGMIGWNAAGFDTETINRAA